MLELLWKKLRQWNHKDFSKQSIILQPLYKIFTQIIVEEIATIESHTFLQIIYNSVAPLQNICPHYCGKKLRSIKGACSESSEPTSLVYLTHKLVSLCLLNRGVVQRYSLNIVITLVQLIPKTYPH